MWALVGGERPQLERDFPVLPGVMVRTQRGVLDEHQPKAVGAHKVPAPVSPETPQAEVTRCHPSLPAPGTQRDVGLDLRPEDSGCTKSIGPIQVRTKGASDDRTVRVPQSPAPAAIPGRSGTGVWITISFTLGTSACSGQQRENL